MKQFYSTDEALSTSGPPPSTASTTASTDMTSLHSLSDAHHPHHGSVGGGIGNCSLSNSESGSIASSGPCVLASATASTSEYRVFLYSQGDYAAITCDAEDSNAEMLCNQICRRLNFKPSVQLLFALRKVDTKCFVPSCRPVYSTITYEFRVRFKMPDHTKLKALDKNAFEYYYYQMRHDLLAGIYPELDYSKNRDKLLGLSVADMYLEMIKSNKSVQTLCKNYKKYIPKEIVRYAKPSIKVSLHEIQKKDHDPYYVMESYMSQLNNIGELYLVENYAGSTDYLPEDAEERQRKRPMCPVKIQIYPVHGEEPKLRIHYQYKDKWLAIPIDEIHVIVLENGHVLRIEGENDLRLSLTLTDRAVAESIVSGLATYYRLLVRWTYDLCTDLPAPSLRFLAELRCHGPIGIAAARDKLHPHGPGYFLFRQCEQHYDMYYMDIKVDAQQVMTYQISRDAASTKPWKLHKTDTEVISFEDLLHIGRSIKTAAEQNNRIGTSVYDKSTALLLCQKQDKVLKRKQLKQINEVMAFAAAGSSGTNNASGGGAGGSSSSSGAGGGFGLRVTCIDPSELRLYKGTLRVGGITSQMRADWSVDNSTCIEVTLKILKPDQVAKNLTTFLHFVQKWSKLKCADILRIYGVTLYNPIAMVMESTILGPFKEWLIYHKSKVSELNLIDAAHSLARALNYLQSRHIVHNKIRCSTVQVVRVTDTEIITRLGDPGIGIAPTMDDLPWIPIEYHHDKMKLSKDDLQSDIWAYGTTIWEMFMYGASPPRDAFYKDVRLKRPDHCPMEMYEIMCQAWDRNREKRFEPQTLFSRLIQIRYRYAHVYQPLYARNRNVSDSTSTASKSSIELPFGMANGISTSATINSANTASSVGEYSGSESSINNIPYETRTLSTIVPDSMSGLSLSSSDQMPYKESYMDDIPSVLEADTYKVILQGVIGSGNFGSVMRGEMWYNDSNEGEMVAVKMIKANNSTMQDFKNESLIMKAVKHKNIVRYIDFLHENNVAIIMEYIPNFSLAQYLISHYPKPAEQLRYAKDIASGMEYLQIKNIVHRDLAARNVLVGTNGTLKISDFGLARLVDSTGYYLVENTDKALPIPWYAPETLEYSSYTMKSDVWSYGVTLFEVFSGGQSPLLIEGEKLDVNKMIQALANGKRLSKPSGCPDVVYNQLMLPCWEYEKMKRPTFTIILQAISEISPEFGEPV